MTCLKKALKKPAAQLTITHYDASSDFPHIANIVEKSKLSFALDLKGTRGFAIN
jgi:hypothetical protein